MANAVGFGHYGELELGGNNVEFYFGYTHFLKRQFSLGIEEKNNAEVFIPCTCQKDITNKVGKNNLTKCK